MLSFHDINFPLPLAFGASGGPHRQTDIVTLSSGAEQRNTSQAHSRRRYDAGIGVKGIEDMQTLITFFEARYGQLYGFRFRDPLDHSSSVNGGVIDATDQQLGIGDGNTQSFQLVKNYQDAQGLWKRPITKPVAGSVVIALSGVSSTAFSLNVDTGVVSFDEPPASGVLISAGFKFDVPVRFDTDHLNVSLENFGAGSVLHVPLMEIKSHA